MAKLEISDSLLVEPDNLEWQEQAACLNYDLKARDEGETNPFYDEDRHAEALAICQGCSVRTECLSWALAYEVRLDWVLLYETNTVYGGFTANERRRILKRHNLLKHGDRL